MVVKRPITNVYGGFYRQMDTYPEVWATKRIPAQRHEIGNFYKASMIRFDDGELLCAPFFMHYFEKPPDIFLEEHFVFLSSRDDGQTWQEVGQRVPGRESRLQLLSDGTLTSTYHWLAYDVNNKTGQDQMGFMRSEDRGRTWESQWLTVEDIQPEAKEFNTSRNVLEMPDGSILLGVSSQSSTDLSFPCRDWLFRSTDSGKTWCEKIPVKVNYSSPVNNEIGRASCRERV